jgi:hypothetical protein
MNWIFKKKKKAKSKQEFIFKKLYNDFLLYVIDQQNNPY